MQRTDFSKENLFTENLRNYNDDTRLQYEITNDYKNMFFYFKTYNSETLSKILLMGLHINIKTSDDDISIVYPMTDDEKYNPYSSVKNFRTTLDIKSINKNLFMLQHNEIMLTGFKPPINDNSISLINKYDIKVYFDWDTTNTMVYKLVIPFKCFYKDSLTLSDSSSIINVSVKVNAIPKPDNNLNNIKGGGLNEGTNGSSKHNGNGNENPTSLYEPSSLKLRVKLFIYY
jgi:hypothetical protein